MNRFFFLLAFLSLPNLFWAQEDQIKLTCYVSACEKFDALHLFEFDGMSFTKVYSAPKVKELQFTFTIPKSTPRIYYIGAEDSNVKPVLLGSEDNLIFKATCENFQTASFKNSEINKQYELTKVEMNSFQGTMNGLIQKYRMSMRNPPQQKPIEAEMKKVDEQKLAYLEKKKAENEFFGDVVALNTYLSFQNNSNGKYKNEIAYFAANYFQFAEWNKSSYNTQPWVYEGFKRYTETLSGVGLDTDLHRKYLEEALAKIPAENQTYKLALSGIINTLKEKSNANLMHFGKLFIEKYKDSDPKGVAKVQNQINQVKSFMIGGEAPNFSQNDLAGNPIELSDFRGKVLLVDFWASWCGPCRRENPNVVKVYNEYKDKGFEILGVSLDRQKERWEKAIETDGLTWQHVSDLKGWQNEVAKLYSVRSIPHTVLIDSEGKILARNLRGPQLEMKLKEIFGD